MKLIKALLIIITMLLLSSCGIGSSIVEMSNKNSDSGKAKARCEQLIDAINNKDRDALMAVFSEKALGEAEDIVAGIDYLFSLFENDIEAWEFTPHNVSESNDHGHKTKNNIYRITVNSGEKEYWVFVSEVTVDTDHPENVGVYYIKAFNSTDKKPDYYIGGIYVPFDEDGAAHARFEHVLKLIKDKDKDAIRELFSEESSYDERDIDGEIDELLNLFPNGIDSWEQESGYAKRWISSGAREIKTAYVYAVYADGEEYWFELNEQLEWTGRPEIEGVTYIVIGRPGTEPPFKTYHGINFAEE